MSTVLHGVFYLVSGKVDFARVLSNIQGRKKRFCESSKKISYPKNRFLVTSRSFFSTYKFFSRPVGVFSR